MTQYSKVHVDGFVVDAYTAESVSQVKQIYPLLGGIGTVHLAQGGYDNGAVAASAGTHDGGGTVDFSLSNKTQKNWNILQEAARWAQFAAWHRLPSQGPWSDHVHSVQVGNSKAAPLAKAQVADYRKTPPRNGLAGHAVDNTWRPHVIFAPVWKMPNLSLSRTLDLIKTKPSTPRPTILRIQRALNKKMGAGLKVTGFWNPKTQAAYAKWEKFPAVGGNGDGIPGTKSLTLLGAGLFHTVS